MITRNDIVQLLSTVKGTTFASIDTDTEVKPAAAHKHVSIRKLTTARVQLFNSIRDYEIFAKAVRRSAGVDEFEQSDNWFEHTDCWSVVRHPVKGTEYLYAVYNGAQSTFTIDGVPATRAEVAALLTPSAAAKLVDDSGVVYNKKNDVEHTVIPRVIALENVKRIKAVGGELQG